MSVFSINDLLSCFAYSSVPNNMGSQSGPPTEHLKDMRFGLFRYASKAVLFKVLSYPLHDAEKRIQFLLRQSQDICASVSAI